MMIDSHEHVLWPVEKQLAKMDEAGIERAVLFGTTPHPELAKGSYGAGDGNGGFAKDIGGG